jgi:glycosyltransferase involved in cell wall biosynthesis
MATIDILLATYNGARYLPEQLRSLEQQTFTDWRLIVRDDGSTDGSLAIVEEWAARSGAELRVLGDGRKGLGACGNFGALLEASDAPYFALCDQDDVWLPEKLSRMLEAVKVAEDRRGSDTPMLAYSDLSVVDSDLREIHPSFRFFATWHAPEPGRLLQKLTIQAAVTGCASLGNAALRLAALPIPTEAAMHDWWLSLVAAGLGELVDLQESTVLYRQHGMNTVGAKSFSFKAAIRRFLGNPAASVARTRSIIDRTQRQARVFAARFSGKVDEGRLDQVRQYGCLSTRSFWERKRFVVQNRLWTKVWLSNVSYLVAI